MIPLLPTPSPRSLPLEPQDWFWATWRNLEPLPIQEPRAFDPKVVLKNIAARPRTPHYQWGVDYCNYDLPRSLTVPEARLWWVAMTHREGGASWTDTPQILAGVQQAIVDECWQTPLTETEALMVLGQTQSIASPKFLLPLLNLFAPETIVSWMLEPDCIPISMDYSHYNNPQAQVEYARQTIVTALLLGWQSYGLPYSTIAQREQCRNQIRGVLDRTSWTLVNCNFIPPVYYLAASVGGFEDVLQPLIESCPDSLYQGLHHTTLMQPEFYIRQRHPRPQELIFGLTDPDLVAFHMNRLGLKVNSLHLWKGWLAHREYAGLDLIRDSILALSRKEDAVTLLRQTIAIVAPELAPIMLELSQQSMTVALSSRWLTDHSSVALAGVLANLQGLKSIPELTRTYLERRIGRGDGAWIQTWVKEQLGDRLTETVQTQITTLCEANSQTVMTEETTPLWLQQALHSAPLTPASTSALTSASTPASTPAKSSAKSPDKSFTKLPKWLDAGDVKPLVWVDQAGQRRSFNRQQMEVVLRACAQLSKDSSLDSSLDSPARILLTALKQHIPASSLADFAWSLFEYWLETGAPTKDSWAMTTLGLLGNDATVLQLTPLIRAWPGESKHKRAIVGLECLKAIGTDTALMQIHAIAQRIQFKSLKRKALECMDSLAAERGLTQEQLADRIVPDCGLNAQGTKIYDYGSRQFRVVLSPDLKPLIRDGQNKLKASLPRATKQDDPALVKAAAEDWKILKKTLSQVVSLQAKRLERGMLDQRRWERSEFETYILKHPVLWNLSQRLIWGCYGTEKLSPTACFRITEDGTYANAEDEELDLTAVLGDSDGIRVDGIGVDSTGVDSTGVNSTRVIGLVHPVELTGMQLQQWGQLLSDYEIVPPFPQLSRTVFTLEPRDHQNNHIQRFQGKQVPALIAAAIFKNTGWEQLSYAYAKAFPKANITAIVLFDHWGDVMPLGDIFFIAGVSLALTNLHQPALPLTRISPVILSEVLRNIGAIASKEAS